MSILCPIDMLIHGIDIQLNGAESIDISFLQNLQIRLIPERFESSNLSPAIINKEFRKIRNSFLFATKCNKKFIIIEY